MKQFIIGVLIAGSISNPTIAAEQNGEWDCIYREPNYVTTLGIKLVGGKLVETTGTGQVLVQEKAAISGDYVVWNKGTLDPGPPEDGGINSAGDKVVVRPLKLLATYEFYPNLLILRETVQGVLSSVHEYRCYKKGK